MNWSPTALLVFLIFILVSVSIFGGYFGYTDNEAIGGELPSGGWSLITSAASFYFDLLIFNIEGVPYIFSIIWWLFNLLGIYCVIKIIWPGA